MRTVWTRAAQALAVGALALTPWLLLRLVVNLVFLPADDEHFAPDQLFWVRAYLGYLALELLLAVALALVFWALGRRLMRSGGRPTRRTVGGLVTATVLLGLLAVDAFTFALIRALAG